MSEERRLRVVGGSAERVIGSAGTEGARQVEPVESVESVEPVDGLADGAARRRIRTDTGATLFVEAGAGSGKTTALVERVCSLVLTGGVPLSAIAAVTFTEKAGAELRDRLRAEFERAWLAARDGADPRTTERAEQALDDLDAAAIGTLHSFAQQLLTAHPIEAGLPPMIEVLDEVGSSVAFEERWTELQRRLLDDDEIAQPLLLAMAVGVELKHLRSLAKLFGNDWDLITDRVLTDQPHQPDQPGQPAELSPHDIDPLIAEAARLATEADKCRDHSDRLLAKVRTIASFGELLDGAADPETQLAVLQSARAWKFGNAGRKDNWPDVNRMRQDCAALVEQAGALVDRILNSCLRQLSVWVAERVLAAADRRRAEGRLEFHDLLVLTRDLLRRDPEVREALKHRYERLLLDEFQDTDPIQIELAVRIAGGAAAVQQDWREVDVPAGRLFVVGDPKQSIYRFRRANIATYLSAQDTFGETVALTTNFRSVPSVLDWVNTVFGTLIQPFDGAQPHYQSLDAHRPPAPTATADEGPPLDEPLQLALPLDEEPDTGDPELTGTVAVTVLGAEPHEDLPRSQAPVLREREAADVAAVVQRALTERWPVWDTRAETWRDAGPGDIAVLVPARTSLPFLENALDGAGVPYRAEASSLVYQTAEVRSLLACARAIADPSDQLSLVTALRSPLFGCGDDDLFTWKQRDGSFNLTAPVPDGLEMHPVGSAMRWLRDRHSESRWSTPSEVLATIVAERRMLEVAAGGPRARDVWRRLRFVVDQARAWSEVEHGGLRGYLAWAAHQGEETSRVAEAILPETDADAVRVMTIHAAKGLEFPIVVLSGMTASPNRQRGVQVIWPAEGGYAVRFRKSVQTEDFDLVQPLDEQMDDYERRRLLYVAATRARDHLVVSLHRGTRRLDSNAELLATAGADRAGAVAFDGVAEPASTDTPTAAVAPPPYDEWLERISAAREASRRRSAQSASGLEGTDPEVALLGAEPGTAKAARDVELPPWSKGRYGTAVGRAVHGVLQDVDLTTGAGLTDAVAAQCVAEGVTEYAEVVAALARSALDSEVVRRAAGREHWRESFVGTVQPDGTVLEGFVDLIYREDDGSLVIVDYKTDAVPAAALDSRVAYYAPQLRTYAGAVGNTGATVSGTTLLFLDPTGATPRPVPLTAR